MIISWMIKKGHLNIFLFADTYWDLLAILDENNNPVENVNIALDTAKKNANPNDLIIVIGSIFLVAEVNR